MKIYVASSWRNEHQPRVVSLLKRSGFDVYDFRQPTDGDSGFHWKEIDAGWESWTHEQFVTALDHELARKGFGPDLYALKACDVVVLVLPAGRSAHLEAGFAAGAGKKLFILQLGELVPELMYKMADLVTDDIAVLGMTLCELRANSLRCQPRAGR